MSESRHTPGPWWIERYGDGESLVIHSDVENRVCFMATPGSAKAKDNREIQANAALIAAAPDLLAALRGFLAVDAGWRELATARAAIAKAEGRE